MKLLVAAVTLTIAAGAFFLFFYPRTLEVGPNNVAGYPLAGTPISSAVLLSVPEAQKPTSSPPVISAVGAPRDIAPQEPLSNPPDIVKGIYLTGWSAGYAPKIDSLIKMIGRTELNAVVIDIKDYSGYVSYKTEDPLVLQSGAENQIKIAQPNALIKKLHDAGIYVIGRITVFQDPILAKAHPEWALKNASTSAVWTDNKELAWMDPAAEPVWKYNLAIAKDAIARGFDEVQFDYVRFASDGNLGNISYPFWDKKTPRHLVIGKFFKFLRGNMPDAKLSADLFGLSAVDAWDDLGIGQVIEDAYKYFDYVSPMVYPSHYAPGTLGYKNPAKYPYEIIKYSLDHALARLIAATSDKRQATSSLPSATSSSQPAASYQLPTSKLRPWLQDFDLGAIYDAAMVKKEMQAVYDASGCPAPEIASQSWYGASPELCSTLVQGWLLWDPANNYTEGALNKVVSR